MKKLLILLSIFAAFTTFAADLVKNGKSVSVIVLARRATISARFAADELNFHIEKITGTKLPIVRTAQPGKTNIFIGANTNTPQNKSFARQEYLVKVKGNHIYLCGRDAENYDYYDYDSPELFPHIWDAIGSCYAVYDFLEMLGVRWYLPTDLGLHAPKRNNLSVKDMEFRRVPTMEYREPHWIQFNQDIIADNCHTGPVPKVMNHRDQLLFQHRSRVGGRKFEINHSFYSYYTRFPGKKDWFAKGYATTKPPQMCLTNKEFLQQVVKDARAYFDGKIHPRAAASSLATEGLDCFPIFPMDNCSWCKCAKCKKILLPKAVRGYGKFSNDRASNYVFQFVNKVAKEIKKTHPDKLIGAGAYSDYAFPPDFKVESNVRIMACLHARHVFSPATILNDKAIMDAWTKHQPQVSKSLWLYYCFPYENGKFQNARVFPGFFANKIPQQFKEYVKANVRGTFMQVSYGKHTRVQILFDQLEGYLYWKLCWNKELDGHQIINEFFRNYYGPAEKPMKDFYMLVQERYTNPKYRIGKASIEKISWEMLGTKTVMNQLNAYMKQAEQLANTEPYKARVRLFKRGVMDYMQLGYNTYVNRALISSNSMSQIDVPCLKASIPGDPKSIPWDKAGYPVLYGGLKAEPLKQNLSVSMAHDGTFLYLRYAHNNTDPAKKDNIWITYFGKQRAAPYQMVTVNTTGAVTGKKDLGTLQEQWHEPGKIVHIKTKNTWIVLMALKLSDIVPTGIKPGELLYYNVFRVVNNNTVGCWIPTFSDFNSPDRFGELYLLPIKK